MRGLAAAAVVMMGCGARPEEPLPVVTPQPKPAPVHHEWNPIRVARPDLPDVAALVPDLTEQLRWPLTVMEHPVLEPRYPVARDLAVAGISWTELCERGVQNRRDPSHKDELAYLGAWCLAESHDTADAVRALAPLEHSSNLELSSAVPYDLVNVVVADVDYPHADKLFTDENLRDPMLWDLLAAAYFEVGKNVDSYQASKTAAQLDANSRMETRCRRIARLAMLGSLKPLYLDELADAAKQKIPDPTCVDLALRVPCAVDPAARCEPFLKTQHFVPWRAVLLTVYEEWPEVAGWSTWLDYAWKADHTWPAEGSLDLITAALDAAVGTADCELKPMEDISRGAFAMAIGIPALQAKAEWVHTMLVDERACHAFHDQWVASHR